MAVEECFTEPAEYWPSPQELREMAADGSVVILPDQILSTDEGEVAGFRPDAHELRVIARQHGHPARLATVGQAKPKIYREHAADWILPVIFALAENMYAALAYDLIKLKIKQMLDIGTPIPTVRVRGLVINDEGVRVKNITGPGEEVVEVLRTLIDHDPAQLGRGEKT